MKIAPGLRLNLGKRGASVRVGTKGVGMTVGSSGKTVSAGLPGTGLSVSHKFKKSVGTDEPKAFPTTLSFIFVALILGGVSLWVLVKTPVASTAIEKPPQPVRVDVPLPRERPLK
jgi:hypothetical protein